MGRRSRKRGDSRMGDGDRWNRILGRRMVGEFRWRRRRFAFSFIKIRGGLRA